MIYKNIIGGKITARPNIPSSTKNNPILLPYINGIIKAIATI